MSVAPILIVVLSYNIWNNTSTDNILHQLSLPGNWTPPHSDHESLLMYLFPISFIAQFIISALRAVLLIPGPHFPVPLSLTHIQSCYLRPGTQGAELTLRDTGGLWSTLACSVNWDLMWSRVHRLLSESSVVSLSINMRRSFHHQLREKCIRRLTRSVFDFRAEMERLGESQCQHCKLSKVHTMTFDTRYATQTNHNFILWC